MGETHSQKGNESTKKVPGIPAIEAPFIVSSANRTYVLLLSSKSMSYTTFRTTEVKNLVKIQNGQPLVTRLEVTSLLLHKIAKVIWWLDHTQNGTSSLYELNVTVRGDGFRIEILMKYSVYFSPPRTISHQRHSPVPSHSGKAISRRQNCAHIRHTIHLSLGPWVYLNR